MKDIKNKLRNIIVEENNNDMSLQKNKLLKDAILNDNLNTIKELLNDKSFDILSKDILRLAVYKNKIGIVELLLNDERFDVNDDPLIIEFASKIKNYPFIEYILSNNLFDPSVDNNKALRIAVNNGDKRLLAMLLKDDRVDPSVNNNQVLYTAKDDKKMLRMLLSHPKVKSTLEKSKFDKFYEIAYN